MRKKINLFLIVFGLLTIIGSFFSAEKTASIMFIEVNIWIFRLFWFIVTIGVSYEYFTQKKDKD